MRKIVVILLSLVMLASSAACSRNADSIHGDESASKNAQVSEKIQLTNKMTSMELEKISKHKLTLLDSTDERQTNSNKTSEHTVSVEYCTADELRETLENNRSNMTEEEGQKLEQLINGSEQLPLKYILVDNVLLLYPVPNSDPNYDGGTIDFALNNDGAQENKSFANFEEYLDWIREDEKQHDYSDAEIENDILRMRIANEALQTGEYEVLPAGSIDATDQSLYASNQNADYRNVWEYDRDAVEKIKDSIDEINIYDEELDVDFLVHVTLPPDYDNSKTYPVFFLTDGVWRFGNCTELRSVMENGEAAPVILVSLGYDYNIDGTDNDNRITYFIQKGSMLLDFITDNLMPYLGENYSIDYTNSTLYGHSNGGVFTHEALFQSDLYENQPFGNYIIGSPAFWNLYHEELGVDPEDYSNDYGYFDRNDTLDKKVFLCGGTLEDSDYSEYYNGHDTTLEGLEKLNQRLESHNANVTYQLYHTHHYQYIPEMLTAYLKQTYPVT